MLAHSNTTETAQIWHCGIYSS